MTEFYFNEDNNDEIADLLVGRRIVETRFLESLLVLDDGTTLVIQPNEGGCSCGAGDYDLVSLATTDNIITSAGVSVDPERDGKYEYADTTYRIYVISDNTLINAAVIEGNDGNGYYGTGFGLHVKRPA